MLWSEVTCVEEGHDVVFVTVLQNRFRNVISKDTFVVRCGRLVAERRCLGHGVSCGEAYEEESHINIIGYGMSVVARSALVQLAQEIDESTSDVGLSSASRVRNASLLCPSGEGGF